MDMGGDEGQGEGIKCEQKRFQCQTQAFFKIPQLLKTENAKICTSRLKK